MLVSTLQKTHHIFLLFFFFFVIFIVFIVILFFLLCLVSPRAASKKNASKKEKASAATATATPASPAVDVGKLWAFYAQPSGDPGKGAAQSHPPTRAEAAVDKKAAQASQSDKPANRRPKKRKSASVSADGAASNSLSAQQTNEQSQDPPRTGPEGDFRRVRVHSPSLLNVRCFFCLLSSMVYVSCLGGNQDRVKDSLSG